MRKPPAKKRPGPITKIPENDMVNHPAHYTQHPTGVECIDIIEHYPANVANAMKYLWRCNDKHELPYEDLEKAAWYVQREITRLRKLDEGSTRIKHE